MAKASKEISVRKSVAVTIEKDHVEVGHVLGPVSGAQFATPYDPNRDSGIDFKHEETRTHQSFAGECDINTIVKRGLATGQWPNPSGEAVFADVSDVSDYRAAIDIVRESERMFSALPAEVRRQFQNDPAEFIEFATDAKNNEKLVEWGLAKAQEPIVAPGAKEAPKNADKKEPEAPKA